MMTLRCPKEPEERFKGRSHAGYIILAEPIGSQTFMNNHHGQSLLVRPSSFYTTIFRDLGLDIVASKYYKSYKANDTYEINAERVWLL